MKKLVGLLVIVVLLFAAIPASGTSVAKAWSRSPVAEAPSGSPLAACVDAAQTRNLKAWTCMGGTLSTAEFDTSGELLSANNDVEIVPTPIVFERPSGLGVSAQYGDDIDTWCENGSVCGRKISSYIAEVKGNGAWGDQTGARGAFDQVLRQAFDGPYPRWRATLIWDSGPAVNGYNWHIKCRQERTGPDGTCGDRDWDPVSVSSSKKRTDLPSSSGYFYNEKKLSGSSTKYHDDYYGAFKVYVNGKALYLSSGTIHTGRWTGCASCKYFQAPYK